MPIVTDEESPTEERMPPILLEMRRIFGDLASLSREPQPFLMLPLQGDDDALAFLQTVSAGVRWEELLELAVQYRATHPVRLPQEP
jgi:hypothetical protein